MGSHVKAVTSLCKRTDSARGQSQRGAAVAVTASVEVGSAYWFRALWGRDGRLSGPIGEELEEEPREELEMRSLPELEMQGRDPVCLRTRTGEKAVYQSSPGPVTPICSSDSTIKNFKHALFQTWTRRRFTLCQVGGVLLTQAVRCCCMIKTFFLLFFLCEDNSLHVWSWRKDVF